MNEKHERALRRKAVRLSLAGLTPRAIRERLGRSRRWVFKWLKRFEAGGWVALKSASRRPWSTPRQYPPHAHEVVARTRRQLEKRKVGLVGARSIQRELRRARLLRRIPAAATVYRWLHAEGVLKSSRREPPEPYLPHPTPAQHYTLHLMDWTLRYLEGGTKVYVFHTVEVTRRDLRQTIHPDKRYASARQHVLHVWRTLGWPDGLQLDNDSAFNGGHKAPRLISQLVRLCLYVGVEPIFIPVDEPEWNGLVEGIHSLWDRGFWRRRRFRSLAHVRRAAPEFETWYTQSYLPTQPELAAILKQPAGPRLRLTAPQVRALPDPLPITIGRIHFIRQVNMEGDIELLNETWHVHKRLAGQYVWATVTTRPQRLSVYYRRAANQPVRLVKTYQYALSEPIAPLQPEFKRPYRRRRMGTML
jgi:putative transposase